MKKWLALALPLVAMFFMVNQAGAVVPSKCTSTKFKASGKKAYSRAKCYAKAVAKAALVDGVCLGKASEKFSKSFAKAETQGSCNGGTGDRTPIENKVDAFVDDIRDIVNSSGPGPSICDSKKLKASGKKANSKCKCQAKAVKKGLGVDPYCLSKAETKFSSAISKAELKGGCTHTGQTMALESAVNAFIDDLAGELNPVASTTTSTSTSTSTTTSTLGPRLFFTTTVGTTSCGGAGLSTPPAPPVSGELDSDTAGTTKIVDLGLGCLYFGGGNATVVAGGAIPDGATQILGVTGGNTLVANPGTGPKSCTQAAGPGKECVNNNATPACTNDGNCGGSAGSCALVANCYFGPPLPIPSPAPFQALTTCVLNVIQTDASGTVNLGTGDSDVNLNLSSRVYITGNTASPCPKCISGTCDATWKTNTLTTSPDSGQACTTNAVQMTTIDCRPSLPGFQAGLAINIAPLTTGHTMATDAGGLFCPGQGNAGAFGQGGARAIQQQGMAAGDLTDGLPHNAILGYSFCIPATGNAAVDGVADLPGPGSLGLNGESQYVASPSGAFLDASVRLP